MYNEDSRVKIPALLHFTRLGYTYLSLKENKWDLDTNIFTDVFKSSLLKINPEVTGDEIDGLYKELVLLLQHNDLGKAFYKRLLNSAGIKLIDFNDFSRNTFHVVTELPYKKDDEEFRPDITLLINGMPLAFVEVKKPNNKNGIIAERKRMVHRFENRKLNQFFNSIQLMVFSNNMEYDDNDPDTIEGAFYGTTSSSKLNLNYFRSDPEVDVLDSNKLLKPVDEEIEGFILKDTNYAIVKGTPEYITNKQSDTPTHRICSELFSLDRFAFLLQFGIAYVDEKIGETTRIEKHVMRYPQLFATKAIEQKLEEGAKKGIIWHTQGSGKTALAYYNVCYLTSYYSRKGIIPKFYFVVDRIDLAEQAQSEFLKRGLKVNLIASRKAFTKEIKNTHPVENTTGQAEITIVNIQKFEEDQELILTKDYNLNFQRVYFLDEVHRSYDPKGSFAANLVNSDPDAIKIGLTGTPLIGKVKSTQLFGDYIHKYYYDLSIRDGYTLRLMREDIDTSYKMQMKEVLDRYDVIKGSGDKKKAFAHDSFVEPMLDYIVDDLESFRLRSDDESLGGMVVCDSHMQAKKLYELFQEKYSNSTDSSNEVSEPGAKHVEVAEPAGQYGYSRARRKKKFQVKKVALILHDIDTKEDRKRLVKSYKSGDIDLLIVYNMLLTGFDAKRLKKLYVGRVVKDHNLLQMLTRVNRAYIHPKKGDKYKYGYVVDFADIEKEFDKTNQAYYNELQDQYGDDAEVYDNLFISKEEAQQIIENAKEVLWSYDLENAELFNRQINEITDCNQIRELVKALKQAKEVFNLLRLQGDQEELKKLDINNIARFTNNAQSRLEVLNTREAIQYGQETGDFLNEALEDIIFEFSKVGESEMLLADQLKDLRRKVREALADADDQKDPEFISLRDELKRLMKLKNIEEQVTQEELEKDITELRDLHERIKTYTTRDNRLKEKYANDPKLLRVHKRIMESRDPEVKNSKLFKILYGFKEELDHKLIYNSHLIQNQGYVEEEVMELTYKWFEDKHQVELSSLQAKQIQLLITNEYFNDNRNTAS